MKNTGSRSFRVMLMTFDLTPLWISFKTTLVTTVIVFFLGIGAARWVMNLPQRVRGIVDALFTFPMIFPPTVLGFFLLLLLGNNSPLGQLLKGMGMNLIFSWSATVVSGTVVAFPLMYRTARGAFEQVDRSVIDVARTLGLSKRTIFMKILLPLSLPGLMAGTVLSFSRTLGEFGATLMIAGNIPGKTQTLPIAIFFAVEGGDMRTALAWVGLIMLLSLLCMVLQGLWSFRSKATVSGR
ncbi:molybdate transport system permease protein [Thermoclostridium caenicola]|uniref:Molybdenum transport system permease n=2 Tax=Thermoclostridium caenicola TaxID=659425 RepID=A0A1M6IN48_9FIRM|nr:molybdate transport system permease protein [Thermoclostridium caenicola]